MNTQAKCAYHTALGKHQHSQCFDFEFFSVSNTVLNVSLLCWNYSFLLEWTPFPKGGKTNLTELLPRSCSFPLKDTSS